MTAIRRPGVESGIRRARIGDHLFPFHVPKLHVSAKIAETSQQENVALGVEKRERGREVELGEGGEVELGEGER